VTVADVEVDTCVDASILVVVDSFRARTGLGKESAHKRNIPEIISADRTHADPSFIIEII